MRHDRCGPECGAGDDDQGMTGRSFWRKNRRLETVYLRDKQGGGLLAGQAGKYEGGTVFDTIHSDGVRRVYNEQAGMALRKQKRTWVYIGRRRSDQTLAFNITENIRTLSNYSTTQVIRNSLQQDLHVLRIHDRS